MIGSKCDGILMDGWIHTQREREYVENEQKPLILNEWNVGNNSIAKLNVRMISCH